MSKLTEEALAVVDEGRDAFAPSADVTARLRERIRRATDASEEGRSRDKAALPVSGELAEPAASPSVLGRAWSTNRGLILLAAAIGLTASVSTSTLMSRRAASSQAKQATVEAPAPAPSAPDPELPSLQSPALEPESAGLETIPAAAPSSESKIVEPRVSANEAAMRVARPAPSANPSEAAAVPKKRAVLSGTTESDSLEAEMLLISAAQAALKGDARAAVHEHLDEHERRFPRGLLREERLTLRVRLLCVEGRAEEAKRALRALESEHPRSSHLASLRDSCVGEGK